MGAEPSEHVRGQASGTRPYEVVTLSNGRVYFAIPADKISDQKVTILQGVSSVGSGLADFGGELLSLSTLGQITKHILESGAKGCALGAVAAMAGLVTTGPGCLAGAGGALALDGVSGIFTAAGTLVGSFVEAAKAEGVERELWLRQGGRALGGALLQVVPAVGSKLRIRMKDGAPLLELFAPGKTAPIEKGITIEMVYRGIDSEGRHIWEAPQPKPVTLSSLMRPFPEVPADFPGLRDPAGLAVTPLRVSALPKDLRLRVGAVAGLPNNHPRASNYPGLNDPDANLAMNGLDLAWKDARPEQLPAVKQIRSGALRLLKLGSTRGLSESTRAIVLQTVDGFVLGDRYGVFHDLTSEHGPRELSERYFLPMQNMSGAELVALARENRARWEKDLSSQAIREVTALKAVEDLLGGLKVLADDHSRAVDRTLDALAQYFQPRRDRSRAEARQFSARFSNDLGKYLESRPLDGAGVEAGIFRIVPKDLPGDLQGELSQMGIGDAPIALKVSPTSRMEEGKILVLLRRAAKLADASGSDALAHVRDYQSPFVYSGDWAVGQSYTLDVDRASPLVASLRASGVSGMSDDKLEIRDGKVRLHMLALRWVEAKTLREHFDDKLKELGQESSSNRNVIDQLNSLGAKINPNVVRRLELLLDTAHSAGVSHRDLNLGNIFVKGSVNEVFDASGKSDPEVVLHDFGQSSISRSEREAREKEDTNRLTQLRSLLPKR